MADGYLPTDRLGLLRKVTSFPTGIVNDGIFGYIINGNRYVRTKTGPVNIREAGIYANGIDQSARFSTVLANAKIKELEIHVEGGGEILLTAAVSVPVTTVYRVSPGTMIKTTGSGAFTGGIVDADPTSQIYSGTKNSKPTSTTTGYVSANWYGANAPGINGTDNAAAVNFGAQIVINSSTLPRDYYFPDLLYNFSAPLHSYKWTDAGIGLQYYIHHINWMGRDDTARQGHSTVFQFTTPQSFGLGIQVGKGCTVEMIQFLGTFNPSFANQKEFTETRRDDFGASLGVIDKRCATNAAIIIDPWQSVVPTGGGYTDLPAPPEGGSWYRGPNTGSGSTSIHIRHCGLRGWLANAAFSINLETQNCDSMVVEDCNVDTCRYGFTFGQDQTKNCVIRNIVCWVSTHTFVTNAVHGRQSGAPPSIELISIAGMVNQVFYVNTSGRLGLTANKIFAESLYRLGTLTGMPSTVRDSHFNFILIDGIIATGIGAPDVYGTFTNVHFDNCLMNLYDNLFNKRLHFTATNCLFTECRFDLPPVFQRLDLGADNTFVECSYGGGNGALIGAKDVAVQDGYLTSSFVQYGKFNIVDKTPNPYIKYTTEYEFGNDYEGIVNLANITLTVNTTTRTATFPYVGYALYGRIGDYILTDTSKEFYDSPGTGLLVGNQILGRVIANSGSVVTLSEVPVNVISGTYYSRISWYKVLGNPFIGDLSTGSAIITNVEFNSSGAPPYVGMKLDNALTPMGWGSYVYITNVNLGAKQVTMSEVAGATRKDVSFSAAKRVSIESALYLGHTFFNTTSYPLAEGTEWVAKGNSFADGRNRTIKYKITKSGYISQSTITGALRQAEWVEEFDFRVSGGNIEWNNGGTWTPASPWLDNSGYLTYGGKVFIGNTGTPWRELTINRTNPSLSMSQLGTERLIIGVAGSNDEWITGTVSGDAAIKSVTGKMYFSTNGGTSSSLILGTSQAVTIPVLAGTGSRMVVASSAGMLSTQAIYTGPAVVVTATDVNSTLASGTDLEILPTITADRTLTLPDPTTMAGAIKDIWNKNSTTFKWAFASAITLGDDTTSTTIPNDGFITIQSNGVVWAKKEKKGKVVTATDANATMASDTDLEILPPITAARTLTLPAAASFAGKTRRIWNKNTSSTFLWTFANAVTLPDGTTDTTIQNGTTITLESDGVVWVEVENTFPTTFYHDSTLGGSGSTSGDPIFFKGDRNYTTTQRDALTGKNPGDRIFNTTTGKWQGWNGTIWVDFTTS